MSGSHSWALPTSTATEVAMQRWPAAPKPAPTRALTVLRAVGIGQHHGVVLGAHHRLHALAVLAARL